MRTDKPTLHVGVSCNTLHDNSHTMHYSLVLTHCSGKSTVAAMQWLSSSPRKQKGKGWMYLDVKAGPAGIDPHVAMLHGKGCIQVLCEQSRVHHIPREGSSCSNQYSSAQ